MIPLLARHGIEWIATDEEILGCSLNGKVGRDSRGHVRHPELLYRPWKVSEGGPRAVDRLPRPLDVGPGRLPLPAQPRAGRRGRLPRQAPRDRRRLPAEPRHARPGDPRRRELLGILPRRRRLVPPLALPGGGPRPAGPARRPSASSSASTRRPTPCPGSSPGAGSATTSPSGSATPRTTAAGTPCTRPASSSSRRRRPAGTTPTTLARAWDEMYIAEGSDWFWWYGDDHSSALDALFDHLFRKHLRNVYTLLGRRPARLPLHADLAGRAATGRSTTSRTAS